MSRIRFALIAVVSAVVAAAGAGPDARAATLGDAKIGFSAERTLTIDGKSYVGRMWNMPGKQRHEQELKEYGNPIFILRADSAIADIVLPQLHTVVQLPFPAELAVLESPKLLSKPLGPEAVNGVATTKYALDETVPAGHAAGTLWLSADGIPMKLDATFTATKGKVTTVRWELRHVKIGPQPAALFEAPSDYSKLPPEAVAPLLGMRFKPAAR